MRGLSLMQGARRLRPRPGAADLNVHGGVLGRERHVEPHVKPILARDFVAEAGAARHHALVVVEFFEIVPYRPAADETDDAEALPELPAELGFDLSELLALVAQNRRAA